LGKKAAQANGVLKPAETRKLSAAAAKLTKLTDLQDAMGRADYVSPFFLYRLHFSEVFEKKGGFDIVVANPPYVRYQSISTPVKNELELNYPDYYSGQADLLVYFFARALQLTCPNGFMSFITSNKYLRAGYGVDLRRNLREKTRLETLVDFGDLPIFEATAYPCIVQMKAGTGNSGNSIHVLTEPGEASLDNLRETVSINGFHILQSSLGDDGWNLLNPQIQSVIQKLAVRGNRLKDHLDSDIYTGINTGLNEAYVIDQQKYQQFFESDPRNADVLRPFLTGKGVKRWSATWTGKYLIVAQIGIDMTEYPDILTHLEQYRTQLERRTDYKPRIMQWYHLRACDYYDEFDHPKIIYPDISTKPQFAFDEEQHFYMGNTSHIIPNADLFLVGILNSTPVEFYYATISTQLRGGYYRFFTQYVETIPIPNPPADLRERIAVAARACLDAVKDHPDRLPALEAELNALVYQA